MASRAEMVVLGSAGWMPHHARATTSIAVRKGDTLLLFDAGTGIARLKEPGLHRLLPQDGPIHVFLSHLHLDHTVGLSFIPALWTGNPTVIHVPDLSVCGFPPTILDHLIGPPFYPYGFDKFPMPVTVEPTTPGILEVEGIEVAVRLQRHPGSSLGFRVGDGLAFLTDTVIDTASTELARGVELLIHEAWIRGEGDPPALRASLAAHSSAEGAAEIARDAGAGELLLSHLTPLQDEAFHADMLARARSIFANTNLCQDGLSRFLARC